MTVPVLREFLDQNSGVEVIVVSRNNFADLFCGIGRLVFHGIDLDRYKGALGMNRLAEELTERYSIDFVADLHDVIRTKILNAIFTLKGLPVFKIDKGKDEKKHLTNIWNIGKEPLKQTVERYADVFREMGFPVTLSHALQPLRAEKEGIGIAPFAQHQGKMLPLEKTMQLAVELAQYETVYFFGGGTRETALLADWQNQIANTVSLAGQLSLKEELEAISRLKLMISMDSANMHLASLVGTRCISIWGSTHPYAGFLGYGQSVDDIVQVKDLTCRPCSVFGDKPCYRGDWACLAELQPEVVLEKVYCGQ